MYKQSLSPFLEMTFDLAKAYTTTPVEKILFYWIKCLWQNKPLVIIIVGIRSAGVRGGGWRGWGRRGWGKGRRILLASRTLWDCQWTNNGGEITAADSYPVINTILIFTLNWASLHYLGAMLITPVDVFCLQGNDSEISFSQNWQMENITFSLYIFEYL